MRHKMRKILKCLPSSPPMFQSVIIRMASSSSKGRVPTVFVPHGAGPLPLLGHPGHKSMVEWLSKLAGKYLSSVKPSSCLVLSAHWEKAVATIQSGGNSSLLFDYYGFSKEAYDIKYPVQPAKELASRVKELLTLARIPNRIDSKRGYDHGVYIPMKLIYPDANLPTVQLSLVRGLDPEQHIKIGETLAPLRDEGVFILGSGMSYHNMRGFRSASANSDSEPFHEHLRTILADNGKNYEVKAQMLRDWEKAPRARAVHPTEEHLIPLMMCFGAAVNNGGKAEEVFYDNVAGAKCAGYVFE